LLDEKKKERIKIGQKKKKRKKEEEKNGKGIKYGF